MAHTYQVGDRVRFTDHFALTFMHGATTTVVAVGPCGGDGAYDLEVAPLRWEADRRPWPVLAHEIEPATLKCEGAV